MSNHRFTRVVVVGLDGLEPSIVEPMLLAGELPNLARLAAQGGYSRVQTTCPAQTPVAWSTFATGVNPGAHGIFDFVRRNPASYLPDLGLNRYEQKNPFVPPRVVNLRRGQALWEVLAADGIASTCLRCPCTYPPDATIGKMLSGLGVPDLRGGFGTATFYTATAGAASQEGEQVIQIHSDPDVPVTTYLPGPLDTIASPP
jgi:predicted AlkP superfamily phosphohydrolase/phosphomutase